MFQCRVSWKNYLIFLGKVCIFFEHSILPIMTILLNGTLFVQNKCCAFGGISWNLHVVFRWLSHLHISTTMVLSITMRIQHQDLVDTQNPILPVDFLKLSEIIWNYLMISGGFWKHLNLSEYIWKYFEFWWFSENKWNYLKLSDDFRHCLKLPHLRREPSVFFFAEKKRHGATSSPGGSGDLRPRLLWQSSILLL